MAERAAKRPALAFFDHVVGEGKTRTRYIYSALPMVTLTMSGAPYPGDARVEIAPDIDLVIHADGVRIHGPLLIGAGRSIRLVARTLRAEAEPGGKAAAIDVSGVDGDVHPVAKVVQTVAEGKPGENAKQYTFSTEAAGEGGPGPDGDDGKDGCDGTSAGSIEIVVGTFAKDSVLELRARGGHGSPGQEGADGARGGPGGEGCWDWKLRNRREGPGPGGPGGNAGLGGRGGRGGNGGTISVRHFGSALPAGLSLHVERGASPERAKDGVPGEGGRSGPMTHAPFIDRHELPVVPGHPTEWIPYDGKVETVQREIPENERPQSRPGPRGKVKPRPAGEPPQKAPGKDGSTSVTTIGFAELTDFVHPTHALMLVQRAKAMMATAAIQSDLENAEDKPAWYELLAWLASTLQPLRNLVDKEENEDQKGPFGGQHQNPLARLALLDVHSEVEALKYRAENEQDFTGDRADEVDTSEPSLAFYNALLKDKSAHLERVGARYDALLAKLKRDDGIKAELDGAILEAELRRDLLSSRADELTRQLRGPATDEIVHIGELIAAEQSAIESRKGAFEASLTGFNCKFDDWVSALTMVAFEPPSLDGGLTKNAMSGIQTADILYKGFTEVVGDDGTSTKKNFLIKSMQRSSDKLSEASLAKVFYDGEGRINVDSHKILVAISDYEDLLENYLSRPEAESLDRELRSLAALITRRNDLVLEYNSLVSVILEMRQEAKALSAAIAAKHTKIVERNDPTLPARVATFSKLYANHIQDAMTEIARANKAYAFWSLDNDYNVFRDVLEGNVVWGEAPVTDVITYDELLECRERLVAKHKHTIMNGPEAQHVPENLRGDSDRIFITDPGLVARLVDGGTVSFTLSRPSAGSKRRPGVIYETFTKEGMYNLRIFGVRVFLGGAVLIDEKTSEPLSADRIRQTRPTLDLQVTHGCRDTFHDRNGTEVVFMHKAVKRWTFKYCPYLERDDRNFIRAAIEIGGAVTEEALHRRDVESAYAGFGPYTDWTLNLTNAKAIQKGSVENIEVQFLYTYQMR